MHQAGAICQKIKTAIIHFRGGVNDIFLHFRTQDGGRLYSEGVFLNEMQCKVLDATRDHNKYVNNLVSAVFGRNILKNSSVTGSASKNYKYPAKTALDPLWVQLIYGNNKQ